MFSHSGRPTEIAEKDVYLCTAHYNEDEMKFRRNVKGFKVKIRERMLIISLVVFCRNGGNFCDIFWWFKLNASILELFIYQTDLHTLWHFVIKQVEDICDKSHDFIEIFLNS